MTHTYYYYHLILGEGRGGGGGRVEKVYITKTQMASPFKKFSVF